ncbi:MAG: helix-turn-helix transcriptional regulator [Pseudomonadota bacterium]
MHDFMTTKEVAEHLRIKERRVYELVRQQAIPCTRVTGKWLFPRRLVDLWLAQNAAGEGPLHETPPAVVVGSHDPLLDWAVRESGCGLALLAGGSMDGLERFQRGEAQLAGLHLYDPEREEFNLPALATTLDQRGLVVLEWAWRRQGLVLPADNPRGVRGFADLAEGRLRMIGRQAAAGSHLLLIHLLEQAGLALDDLTWADETARSEGDLAQAVLEGRADAGLAVEAAARARRLDFMPLMRERFDLVTRRRPYFEAPLQMLFGFARSEAFRARAAAMGGYDIAGLGRVRFNGP